LTASPKEYDGKYQDDCWAIVIYFKSRRFETSIGLDAGFFMPCNLVQRAIFLINRTLLHPIIDYKKQCT
jgi:hypothetical protein